MGKINFKFGCRNYELDDFGFDNGLDEFVISNKKMFGMSGFSREDLIVVSMSSRMYGDSLGDYVDNCINYGYTFACGFMGGFDDLEEMCNTILEVSRCVGTLEEFERELLREYNQDWNVGEFENMYDFFECLYINNSDCDLCYYMGKVYKRVYC